MCGRIPRSAITMQMLPKVIGYVHTFAIEEGVANRFEFGYTRSVHTKGNSPSFSGLWDYSGMNVFNAKAVGIKDGQFGPWTPGIGAGFVVRTGDKFVSSALNQELAGSLKSYTNGDCVRGSDEDMAASPGAVPAECRIEDDQCFDLRTRWTSDAFWRTALRWAGYSGSVGA